MIFALLRKQKGRCAISELILNFNYEGPKQFQMSVDRIDPTDINYWNVGNLQLVCLASNVTDRERDKTYAHEDDVVNGASMTKDWFQHYFDTGPQHL